jgi:hypothetical protein
MSNKTIEIIGWVLFLASSIGFLVSSIKSGDTPSLIGGIFFCVACIVFLIPYFRKGPQIENLKHRNVHQPVCWFCPGHHGRWETGIRVSSEAHLWSMTNKMIQFSRPVHDPVPARR